MAKVAKPFYSTKSNRDKFLKVIKYLLGFNKESIIQIKDDHFINSGNGLLVEVFNIKETTKMKYEGYIDFSKEIMDLILVAEDYESLVNIIEDNLVITSKNFDDLYNKIVSEHFGGIENLTNKTPIATINLSKEFFTNVTKFMSENNDGYHDFYSIKIERNKITSIKFKNKVYKNLLSGITIDGNIPDTKLEIYIPYEILFCHKELSSLQVSLIPMNDKFYILKYSFTTDMFSSNVYAKIDTNL